MNFFHHLHSHCFHSANEEWEAEEIMIQTIYPQKKKSLKIRKESAALFLTAWVFLPLKEVWTDQGGCGWPIPEIVQGQVGAT